jgi:hypothetical protein
MTKETPVVSETHFLSGRSQDATAPKVIRSTINAEYRDVPRIGELSVFVGRFQFEFGGVLT